MQSIVILGRQPALGLAELESLYGADTVRPVAGLAAVLAVPASDIQFARLGGSLKLAQVVSVLDTTEWRDVEKHLISVAPERAAELDEGKLTIGLSVYGLRVNPATINATGLSIKKAIRKSSGRSVRLVPNKELELNTAQVLHNDLTGTNGWELLIIRDGSKTILAQTTAVQDIESYTLRDRGRPKRDARVGMLPPKLAQIIINLATGNTDIQDEVHVMDPFCGTGVVLQEALLMGHFAMGADLDPRMVEYTLANMKWLHETVDYDGTLLSVDSADATTTDWIAPFTTIAGETYLGRPFTSLPAPEVLHQTISEVNLILKKFLKNIARHPNVIAEAQNGRSFRLCIAVPAWQIRPGKFKHLPLIDQLADMGYNRISFEHVRDEELLYYRSDQVVARQLLVLQKK